MKKLSDQIRALRRNTTFLEFSQKTKVNRQTLTELEAGGSVKLSTLEAISDACGLRRSEWIDLLIGWIRAEIGEEKFSLLKVTPATLPWASGQKPTPEVLFSEIFISLSSKEQLEILLTMIRKPVLSCLPALIGAVEQQRTETRQLLGAVLAKELPENVRDHVLSRMDVLSEHDLRESREKLVNELLREVILNPKRPRRPRSGRSVRYM